MKASKAPKEWSLVTGQHACILNGDLRVACICDPRLSLQYVLDCGIQLQEREIGGLERQTLSE